MSSPSFRLRFRQWLAATENQLLLLLLVLAAVPLYYELGRNAIQLWDESRLAINAFEMTQGGHWLVPLFDGKPDHWNTKPPLLIWLEAISFKCFGYSALTMRLPVALANLVTLLALFRFGARTLQRPLAGFFGGLVLVTCLGFIRRHVARTGDYDALLTCFVTISWMLFYQYLEHARRRHLLGFAAALMLATLTKGPAGLFILPGLLAYTIGRGRLWWVLRQPLVYGAALSWVLVIGGYFVWREALDPGYWEAVKFNDLGGRFTVKQGMHDAYWSFYLELIQSTNFSYWLWAAVVGLLLGLLQPDGALRRAIGLLLAVIISWLAVISAAASQYTWYDAPIYPALALLAGIGLALLYHDVLTRYLPSLRPWQRRGLQAGALVVLMLVPYRTVIRQIIEERYSDYGAGPDGHLSRYIVRLGREKPDLDSLTVLYHGDYNAILDFYRKVHNLQPGHQMATMAGSAGPQLRPGTVVVVCNPDYRPPLEAAFRVVELHQKEPCQTLLLLPKP